MNETFAYSISSLRRDFVRYCSEKLEKENITMGQLPIIIYVGKKDNCSPSDISNSLHLDAGHLNRTITKLVTNGFLTQKKNNNDKRSNIVSLTDKGRSIFDLSHEVFYSWDNENLKDLSETEKKQLFTLMEKITRNRGNENE